MTFKRSSMRAVGQILRMRGTLLDGILRCVHPKTARRSNMNRNKVMSNPHREVDVHQIRTSPR